MKTVRELRLRGILSHEEYWGFIAQIVKPPLPRTLERLAESKDLSFNDIPLAEWDSMDTVIRQIAIETKAAYFTMNCDPPVLAWSLSDSVCVAKVYARYLLRRKNDEKE